MTKIINVHYTLLTRCVKRLEVDSNFQLKSKNAEKIYQQLIEDFPEEDLKDIEDDYVYDFDSQDFGGIDGIEVRYDDLKKNQNFISRKKRWF
jgi:hypothetical protein